MSDETFSITYPPVHPGTEKSDIHFYTGAPDLQKVFFSDKPAVRQPRLFVTDATVSALPAFSPFCDNFIKVTAICTNYTIRATKYGDILLILGAGESYKTIETVLAIVQTALDNNLNRTSTFIGIGGGVICDMTAFAASIFKRGARVELVPTTLLAMVDAAVGGKTGCDFRNYKNMIGSFFPAAVLHVWPSFVQSLPADQYRSGLAEVIKTALLYSEQLYVQLETRRPDVMDRKEDIVNTMITECIKAKAAVVERDFTEKGERMQLNFGHTFGHALESVAGLGVVSHGDAVAWGIARALTLSRNLNLCSAEYCNQIKATLAAYGWDTNPIHAALLKNSTAPKAAQLLISAMKKDKKNTSSHMRFVLQRSICKTIVTEVADSAIPAVFSE